MPDKTDLKTEVKTEVGAPIIATDPETEFDANVRALELENSTDPWNWDARPSLTSSQARIAAAASLFNSTLDGSDPVVEAGVAGKASRTATTADATAVASTAAAAGAGAGAGRGDGLVLEAILAQTKVAQEQTHALLRQMRVARAQEEAQEEGEPPPPPPVRRREDAPALCVVSNLGVAQT